MHRFCSGHKSILGNFVPLSSAGSVQRPLDCLGSTSSSASKRPAKDLNIAKCRTPCGMQREIAMQPAPAENAARLCLQAHINSNNIHSKRFDKFISIDALIVCVPMFTRRASLIHLFGLWIFSPSFFSCREVAKFRMRITARQFTLGTSLFLDIGGCYGCSLWCLRWCAGRWGLQCSSLQKNLSASLSKRSSPSEQWGVLR